MLESIQKEWTKFIEAVNERAGTLVEKKVKGWARQ